MAALPTNGNRLAAIAKMLKELEGIELADLPQNEALAAMCRLAVWQHNTRLAERAVLDEEARKLDEARIEAAGVLDNYKREVVAPVAMRYAITHDWCELVTTALAEMGIEMESPEVQIHVVVDYVFTACVHYDHVKALKDDPRTFVAKHLHVPSLVLEGQNETMTMEGDIDPTKVIVQSVEWTGHANEAMDSTDVTATSFREEF